MMVKCPWCQGRGTQHLHGAALGADSFEGDPDFLMNYLNGVYEHPCDHCEGRKIVSEEYIKDEALREVERGIGA